MYASCQVCALRQIVVSRCPTQNTFVKYALIKGLVDNNEVREELLCQSPELNLAQSLAFIEAKEQGKRSHAALGRYCCQ